MAVWNIEDSSDSIASDHRMVWVDLPFEAAKGLQAALSLPQSQDHDFQAACTRLSPLYVYTDCSSTTWNDDIWHFMLWERLS